MFTTINNKLLTSLGNLHTYSFTDDEKMRAVYEQDIPQDIILMTKLYFIGKTKKLSKLKSGVVKYQFCHQMRRQNQNELYYFTLEFEPEFQCKILLKFLENKNSSEWKYMCLSRSKLDESIKNSWVLFESRTIGTRLSLFINDNQYCSAVDSRYTSGSVGIRSDNIKIFFNSEIQKQFK